MEIEGRLVVIDLVQAHMLVVAFLLQNIKPLTGGFPVPNPALMRRRQFKELLANAWGELDLDKE